MFLRPEEQRMIFNIHEADAVLLQALRADNDNSAIERGRPQPARAGRRDVSPAEGRPK